MEAKWLETVTLAELVEHNPNIQILEFTADVDDGRAYLALLELVSHPQPPNMHTFRDEYMYKVWTQTQMHSDPNELWCMGYLLGLIFIILVILDIDVTEIWYSNLVFLYIAISLK